MKSGLPSGASLTRAPLRGKVLWHQQRHRSAIRQEGIAGSIFSMLWRRYPDSSVKHRTYLHQIARNECPLVINSCVNAMGREVKTL